MEKLDARNANIIFSSNKEKCPHCGSDKGFVAGIVLDPFAGAGNTLITAKKLGRQFIGIELYGRYCDTIKERLAQKKLL